MEKKIIQYLYLTAGICFFANAAFFNSVTLFWICLTLGLSAALWDTLASKAEPPKTIITKIEPNELTEEQRKLIDEYSNEIQRLAREYKEAVSKWSAYNPYTLDEEDPYFSWENAAKRFREETKGFTFVGNDETLRATVGWFINDIAEKHKYLKGYVVNKYEGYDYGPRGIYVVNDGEIHAFAAINEDDAKRQFVEYCKDMGLGEEDIDWEDIFIAKEPSDEVIRIDIDGGSTVALFAYQWYDIYTLERVGKYRLVYSSLY